MIVSRDYRSLLISETFTPYPVPERLEIECAQGNLDLLNDLPALGFAVIGTRTPQRRSFELLEQVIADLKGTRLIVISGLARGIDSRAHELAIEHGLKTIAVLGNGLSVDYPPENRPLRNKIIASGGLVISQFEREMQPIRRNFVNRNQLIAGFSKAVWVVEAAAISGTLNTATHAAKFNRDLYATPCFPGDPFFQGNEKLLSEKDTDRYPVAKPLFSVESLSPTWADLARARDPQTEFGFVPKSEIQKWVAEIKAQHGECLVQVLMNHAYTQGLTLGKFYLRYEKEMEAGLITQDLDGRVHLKMG
jgi:DNA protecting protein DprA